MKKKKVYPPTGLQWNCYTVTQGRNQHFLEVSRKRMDCKCVAKSNPTGKVWNMRSLFHFAFLHTEGAAARQKISLAHTTVSDQETAPSSVDQQGSGLVCLLVCCAPKQLTGTPPLVTKRLGTTTEVMKVASGTAQPFSSGWRKARAWMGFSSPGLLQSNYQEVSTLPTGKKPEG